MLAHALALMMAAGAPSTDPTLGHETRQRIDAIVTATMAHQHLPGLSLAIAARGGDLLYARGYGYRDLAARLPADENTVYNIASNTKQFTAAAIMLLAQGGKLTLDDRANAYVPEFRHGSEITLRELLNHTSGIPDYADLPALAHRATAKQFVDLVRDVPLDFAPGSRFEYSNTNYVILGMIVEKTSGMPYGTFLSRRIFDPLSMTSASTRVVPASQPDGAVGYTFAGGRIVAAPQTPDDLGYGDGSINASVLDLVKWDAALDGAVVVDGASWLAMTHAPLSSGYGPRGGYGFGLDLSTMYGTREIYHEGFNVGFGSVNATFPDRGLTIVALSNGDPFQEDLFVRRIFAVISPPSARDVAAEMRSAPGEDGAITAATARLIAQMQGGRVDAQSVTKGLAARLTAMQARRICEDAGARGAPKRLVYRGWQYRDETKVYSYEAYFASAIAAVEVTLSPERRIASVDLARED